MIYKVFVFIVSLTFLGCSSEVELSSEYLLGDWIAEYNLYSCCDTCFENFTTDCFLRVGPKFDQYSFFPDGSCIRIFDGEVEEEKLTWCYNSSTNTMLLKEVDGAFNNIDFLMPVSDISENSFTIKRISTSALFVNNFTRK